MPTPTAWQQWAIGQGGLWSRAALIHLLWCSCLFLDPNPYCQRSSSFTTSLPFAWGNRAVHRQQHFFAALCILAFWQSPDRWAQAASLRRKDTGAAWKKKDLVNLAMIIQEVCGRAANKIQTFCFGGCVFTTTLFFLWASRLVVLLGCAAQHGFLKGRSEGKATL